jgi:16S rRNA (adenine(1408)-N(1))-methyltransferase
VLFLGVDAVADNLRESSRRAPPNALFGRLALEDAPGELAGFADRLTVLFPWGSLLRAIENGEPERLRAICKPGAAVCFVLELRGDAAALLDRHRAAGFTLAARALSIDEARALPTTWAKKLGFSGHPRFFHELTGAAV